MISRFRTRLDIPLLVIAILAIVLNCFNIWNDQYANTYYTTAVASMLENLHNFFYASLDSAGSVTVDKPPVTFWIQTISAWIFGLHGWSVILPQALAGVGSVLLIYFLIKPSFGSAAARIGALVLACTPIAAAVSRTNNIDSMLVFTLLLATWLLFKSVQRTNIGSLLGAFMLIGLAFNMKMLQAYMVLPAFYLFYWLAGNLNWKEKMNYLSIATVSMLVISLSWAVIVDLTPADERPYVGSSETNSVLELAFGYNGLTRLTGNQGGQGGPSRSDRPDNQQQPPQFNTSAGFNGDADTENLSPNRNDTNQGVQPGSSAEGFPAGDIRGMGGMAGGSFGTGEQGPLRLFQSGLSGQASWLLPFVGFAVVCLLVGLRRNRITMKHKETIFWLAWLIPAMVFFSIAGFFHHYYLIMLAPPIAALFGAGWIQLFKDYRNHAGWKGWLLPIAVILTAGFQWYIIHPYNDVIGPAWSIGIVLSGVIFTAALIIYKLRRVEFNHIASILGLFVLLIGPLYWAFTPIAYGGNSMLPQAGPGGSGNMNNFAMSPPDDNPDVPSAEGRTIVMPRNMQGGMGNEASLDSKTLAYLKENNTGEPYLFATTSYQTAAPYMIDEKESVIIMGGFSGSDPVYTIDELENLISTGKVKYFLISGDGMRGGSSELTQWIQENGEEIPSEEWQTMQNTDEQTFNMGGFGRSNTLYKVTL
ncbi:glycosyltransferase family 39 protein [Paenibacillus provencensis]|uniref:Glycosyltransferase family 39 protein n=1 Tax=Paenibacillus provencensis TaxID=441151 RepID=A0ABW3PTB3_9BACL|nr:glycosyltransferase family 39 protein [Paenibacillus sp. MER 78]